LGVVHIIRNAIFRDFRPPPPSQRKTVQIPIFLKGFVTNRWPPLPPKCVTYYMDDPLAVIVICRAFWPQAGCSKKLYKKSTVKISRISHKWILNIKTSGNANFPPQLTIPFLNPQSSKNHNRTTRLFVSFPFVPKKSLTRQWTIIECHFYIFVPNVESLHFLKWNSITIRT
jgi:hypothetical protein